MADDAAVQPAPVPQVEVEPQNALTKKFSERDWEGVKALRTALPLIFEEAFPKDSDARTKVVDLWGVNIDPGRVDDARVSVVLLKFVKAADYNQDKAIERLTATLKWRDEFNVNSTLTESFDEDVFGGLGYIYGKDKEGRPVTYNVYGAVKDLDKVFGDLDRFLRWRVSLMERGMREIDFETVDEMVQVHDYGGVTKRTDESKRAASTASKLFGDHYPECLHVKFFVNIPSWATWVFWLFKPLMPSRTFAKLRMVGPGPQTIGKEMLPYVDAKELPKAYGGEAAGFR